MNGKQIAWFIGANYYKVKGWLLKNGFTKTCNWGFYENNTSGYQEFDNGVEKIIIRCNIIKNSKGNLQCDKVYHYSYKVYDSLEPITGKALNEEDAFLIDPESEDETYVKSKISKIKDYVPYQYMTVDLGLSVKWCEYNLGAMPENDPKSWYGDYYSWGEIRTKDDYTQETYQHCKGTKDSLTKYNANPKYGIVDKIEQLEPQDDVIYQKLGNNYRMPTQNELAELCDRSKIINKCVTDYKGINGLNGLLFISKIKGFEGKSLFIPAAGYFEEHKVHNNCYNGYIWSSSLCNYLDYNYSAFTLDFKPENIICDKFYYRYYGLSIRGVQEK